MPKKSLFSELYKRALGSSRNFTGFCFEKVTIFRAKSHDFPCLKSFCFATEADLLGPLRRDAQIPEEILTQVRFHPIFIRFNSIFIRFNS